MTAESVMEVARLVLNRRVRVISYYDLRTKQPDKYEDARSFEGWTAFVNRKGTLAHVMRAGCEWMMIRIPSLKLGGTSEHYMTKVMSERLYEGLS